MMIILYFETVFLYTNNELSAASCWSVFNYLTILFIYTTINVIFIFSYADIRYRKKLFEGFGCPIFIVSE